MPIPKIEITNPEAIELINKIKSGEFIAPAKAWVIKNRWYLVAIAVFFVLLIALAIGKKVSENTQVQIFTPPDIENISPTETTVVKSNYSWLKEQIQEMTTDLPDPAVPSFDNAIDLEPSTL
jgi:hypothetical protein